MTDTLPENHVYRRLPDVSFSLFGEEGLLVVPRGAWQLVLNGPGARAFDLVDGRRTIGEIADRLAAEYPDTSRDEIVRDVAELLADLAGRGAVDRAGEGAPEAP